MALLIKPFLEQMSELAVIFNDKNAHRLLPVSTRFLWNV